jgi:tetratricopeptide (TPR) repeat protein
MTRTLKSSTIVPAELYVERAADRQLRAIIDEMGRPGYVLVARQMGKTNLLLNLKRQRTADIVVYHDLSNRLDTARRWFRNLIDSILEAYGEYCPKAAVTILEQRNQQLEPNIEYDRHMRLILRESQRKIIVILDEIDSLISTTYSDVIFSQIRSMYFSRANFQEYENLTYVLSGVMEPADLIKDKNISPFNIGEKIYLENFSREEVFCFVQRAGLNFTDVVVDQIYSWVAGNPRMTWDICAELEIRHAQLDAINIGDVDRAVARLYLDEFDRPPVDHIRTLAASDAVIRDAIVSVRYGKANFLSQDVKNKLYLAGVINTAGANATISNKVIDFALSQEWMSSATTKRGSAQGLAMVASGDYRGAVALLEKQRASNDEKFSPEEQTAIATSYLQLGRFTDAAREFRFCLNDKNLDSSKQHLYFGLGQALAFERNFKDAREMLAKAQEGDDATVRERAKLVEIDLIEPLNMALEDAFSFCSEIVSNADLADELDPKLQENAALACFINHKLFLTKGQNVEARQWLSKAKRFATEIELPTVGLAAANLESGRNKIRMLREVVTLLNNGFAGYPLGGDLGLTFGESRMAELLLLLAKANLILEFQQLSLAYASSSFAEPVAPFTAIKHLYSDVTKEEETGSRFIKLLAFAVKNLNVREVNQLEVLEVFREIVAGSEGFERATFARQYLLALWKLHDGPREFFDSTHVDTLANIAISCLHDDSWRLERELYDVWEFYREIDTTFSVGHLYMDFFHLKGATLGKLASRRTNVELANRILKTLKANESSIEKFADENTSMMMKKEVELVLKNDSENVLHADPFRNIGRNDRVVVRYEESSMPVEKKFKFVADDLRNGRCKLIRNV